MRLLLGSVFWAGIAVMDVQNVYIDFDTSRATSGARDVLGGAAIRVVVACVALPHGKAGQGCIVHVSDYVAPGAVARFHLGAGPAPPRPRPG